MGAVQNLVVTSAMELKEPPYALDALEPHMSKVWHDVVLLGCYRTDQLVRTAI